MAHELTSREYWEETYKDGWAVRPINPSGFRNYAIRRIADRIEPYVAQSVRVLEVGGGGSRWLAYFAKKYKDIEFFALDYSERGLRILNLFIENDHVENLYTYEGDLFSSFAEIGTFDLVYSLGVVEHFSNLPEVLSAKKRYLKEGGRMFSLIPNMNGINGSLTRLLNRAVYDIHVPHDLAGFEESHRKAGLEVLESGYLCSNNFGILSSCVEAGQGWKWRFYKALTRIGKLIWYIEENLVDLPRTRLLSPYIYVTSTPSED